MPIPRFIFFLIILSATMYSTAQIPTSSWLTYISDSIPVAHLSIPGAHNAATGNGMKIPIAITQEKTLQEQWDNGIRVFDIRTSMHNGHPHIYHGRIRGNITLERAIGIITERVRNSKEFAIVLLREESGSSNPLTQKEWAHATDLIIENIDSLSATFRRGITVGELRGKILFLSRNSHITKCATIQGWTHSPQGNTSATIKGADGTPPAPLHIQDFYAPTSKEKQTAKIYAIKKHIDLSSKSDSLIWSINHLSGYGSTYLGINGLASTRGYKINASACNRFALDYFMSDYIKNRPNSNGLGIIMLDFAGVELDGKHILYGNSVVEAIIKDNFRKHCYKNQTDTEQPKNTNYIEHP